MALGISGNDFRGAIIRAVVHNDPAFRQRSLRNHGIKGLLDESLLVVRRSDEDVFHIRSRGPSQQRVRAFRRAMVGMTIGVIGQST